jgi:hypothetical protein
LRTGVGVAADQQCRPGVQGQVGRQPQHRAALGRHQQRAVRHLAPQRRAARCHAGQDDLLFLQDRDPVEGRLHRDVLQGACHRAPARGTGPRHAVGRALAAGAGVGQRQPLQFGVDPVRRAGVRLRQQLHRGRTLRRQGIEALRGVQAQRLGQVVGRQQLGQRELHFAGRHLAARWRRLHHGLNQAQVGLRGRVRLRQGDPAPVVDRVAVPTELLQQLGLEVGRLEVARIERLGLVEQRARGIDIALQRGDAGQSGQRARVLGVVAVRRQHRGRRGHIASGQVGERLLHRCGFGFAEAGPLFGAALRTRRSSGGFVWPRQLAHQTRLPRQQLVEDLLHGRSVPLQALERGRWSTRSMAWRSSSQACECSQSMYSSKYGPPSV